MTIKVGEVYITRAGKKATITSTTADVRGYVIAGSIKNENDTEYGCWTAKGRYLHDHAESRHDLIAKVEEPVHEN